jgi:hypothetical protein
MVTTNKWRKGHEIQKKKERERERGMLYRSQLYISRGAASGPPRNERGATDLHGVAQHDATVTAGGEVRAEKGARHMSRDTA